MRSKNGPSDDDKCCHEDAVTCHASRAMTAPVTAVSGWDAARKELGAFRLRGYSDGYRAAQWEASRQ